jgi:hypothetical protein
LSIVPAKPFDGSKDVVDGLGLLEWREGRRPEVSGALAFTAIVQLALVHSDVLTGGAAGMAMPAFQIFGVTLSKGGELYYLVLPVTVMLFLVTGNVLPDGRPVGPDAGEAGEGTSLVKREPDVAALGFVELTEAVERHNADAAARPGKCSG